MVYLAPGTRILFSEMDGPPVAPEPVVVSRLEDPEYAAALVETGVLALKNETQFCALPFSKSYVATTWARSAGASRHAAEATKARIRRARGALKPQEELLLHRVMGSLLQRQYNPHT